MTIAGVAAANGIVAIPKPALFGEAKNGVSNTLGKNKTLFRQGQSLAHRVARLTSK